MKAIYRILQPAFPTSQPMWLCWSLWQQLHSQADLIIVHNCSQSILSQIIEDGAQSQTVEMWDCHWLPSSKRETSSKCYFVVAAISIRHLCILSTVRHVHANGLRREGLPGNPIGCSLSVHTVQEEIHWPLNIDCNSPYETANSS